MIPKACKELSYLPSLCFSSAFCELLFLCYSLFISTCSKIILISWLCIPVRRCTSITWNLTLQEEVVIMAERLILDLNFKRNPVMHKICTRCWCSILHHVRLFQWYLTCCVDTISASPCQKGNSCYTFAEVWERFIVIFYWAISEHPFLFEFGSIYLSKLAIFLYRVLWYLHLNWDIWVNYMKTLYYMADLTSWSTPAINLSALP